MKQETNGQERGREKNRNKGNSSSENGKERKKRGQSCPLFFYILYIMQYTAGLSCSNECEIVGSLSEFHYTALVKFNIHLFAIRQIHYNFVVFCHFH